MKPESIKGWKDLRKCEVFIDIGMKTCGGKVTHVVFLNTPDDRPYVVGTCAAHKSIKDFPYVTLGKFNHTIENLKKKRVMPSDLPFVVGMVLDPMNQTEYPDVCPVCMYEKDMPLRSGDFVCKNGFHKETK